MMMKVIEVDLMTGAIPIHVVIDSNDAGNFGGFVRDAHLATEKVSELRNLLAEITALVRGECPSLLDEDRGGSADLSIAIDEALK